MLSVRPSHSTPSRTWRSAGRSGGLFLRLALGLGDVHEAYSDEARATVGGGPIALDQVAVGVAVPDARDQQSVAALARHFDRRLAARDPDQVARLLNGPRVDLDAIVVEVRAIERDGRRESAWSSTSITSSVRGVFSSIGRPNLTNSSAFIRAPGPTPDGLAAGEHVEQGGVFGEAQRMVVRRLDDGRAKVDLLGPRRDPGQVLAARAAARRR